MNSKAVLMGGIGLFLAGLAAAMSASTPAEKDYTSIPPDEFDVENQLQSCSVSLAEAIETAERQLQAIAKSADIRVDQTPPVIEVLTYSDGVANVVTIDSQTGDVRGITVVSRFPGEHVDGDWIETESGLMYYDIIIGEGAQPADDDTTVKLAFTIWFITGDKFDSTDDRGGPMDLPLSQLPCAGWKEGVLAMRAGGKRKLIIPPDLAFGEAGRPPMIPPAAILVIDVELLEMKDYQAIPENLPGEPVEGEPIVTESGLMYYDLVVGEGDQPAGPETKVKVHYTGYLNDGTKFDSSVDRGEPTDFPLNRVIKGWTEGVGSMRVGGKRKLVIPYHLGYGDRGNSRTIPPKATLIFDIELLEIVEPEEPASEEPASDD